MDIKVPALDGFPLDREQLSLLGEVTALGALIEAVADGIVCRLATEDREAVAPLVAGESIGWMLDKIKLLAVRAPGVTPALLAWAVKAKDAIEQRNLLVHSAWLGALSEPGPPTAIGRRPRRNRLTTFHFKTVAEMAVTRDLLVTAYGEGLDLAYRLRL